MKNDILSTIIEVAGILTICVAAYMFNFWIGIMALGFLVVLIGLRMEA